MGWKGWTFGGLGVAVVAGAAGFFALAPGIAERGMNRTLPGLPPVPPEAAALHATLTVGDLHSDALLWDRDLRLRSDRGHVDLPRLEAGNVAVQVFSVVTKSPSGQNYESNSAEAPDNITLLMIAQLRPPRAWFDLTERALVQAAALRDTAAASPDRLRLIRTRADLAEVLAARADGARLTGGILALEGAHALAGQTGAIARLAEAGYRIIGLTHFFDNELGGSLHGAAGADSAGLSDFGREAVADMIARGLILDLAHASPQVARDVLALPGARVMVSHGGIHGQCPNQRNFPDALMQEVVAAGGIVGIGFWDEAVCGDTVADIAAAIGAAVALLGRDAVALGSDFDGAVTTPLDSSQLASLTAALMAQGMDEGTIAAVMGGNMMRFLAANLPEA
ncbi:MAG: membrane dipeptidase [Rubellimicrobium sp.]|nr:membrane dipeptidase [Rubellimicrobium sp.]